MSKAARRVVADFPEGSTFDQGTGVRDHHRDGATPAYESVRADMAPWLPKVMPGGWLSGDDYDIEKWPEVVAAVAATLPLAQSWDRQQSRWILPAAATAPSVRRLRDALRRR